MSRISKFVLILIFGLFIHGEIFAGESENIFTDTLDNKFDVSKFLQTKFGFLALPIIITEPAIGYGGGATAFFIHRNKKEQVKGTRGFPSISALGGFYTGTKSWAVGGGHMGVWKDGDIRYRGGAGFVSANLNYYSEPIIGDGPDRKVSFNIKAVGIIQEAVFRLWDSEFLAGGSYAFGHTRVNFDMPDSIPPEINSDDFKLNIGGLGLVLYYDTRDNMFTPNRGVYAGVKFIYNDKFLGSDRRFERMFVHCLLYSPLIKGLYGGLRLDYENSFDDVPFFLRPFISLRGIPAMRYQGKSTYLAEAEMRWDVVMRWSLVGFGGYGVAVPNNTDLFNNRTAYNFGAGFRYLIARLQGLRLGLDVARGPEQWAFYIQFGSSWFRY